MRGGAQAHLMRCSDGHYYVVKFKNNPQHPRVLVNDWLGTRLAEMIGLTVPTPAIIYVDDQLIERSTDLRVEIGGLRNMVMSGPCFGSRYVVSPWEGQAYDYLPETMMDKVRSLREFAGILAFDKWTCNADGRQAVFWKRSRERKFCACFIDQGYCFNAGEWNFPDAPLRGVFGRNDVYVGVTGWDSFQPWLRRIETFNENRLWQLVEKIPREWLGGAIQEMERLVSRLLIRRSQVRELIIHFKDSSRNPFPNWREETDSCRTEVTHLRVHCPATEH